MSKPVLRYFCRVWLAGVLLFGCSSNPPITTISSAEVVQTEGGPAAVPEYRLGFGDVVDVKFFRNNEFNETLTVRPDGRISLARIGELIVAGMTPAELDSVITAAYAEILREPDVTVIVRDFGGYQAYVLGEVNDPGGIPLQREMTVLQALAAAGGVKSSAQMQSVMVLRRKPNYQAQAIRLNLLESLEPKPGQVIAQSDIPLAPMDIVFVPKRFIHGAADFMTQLYAVALPPVGLYLQTLIVRDALQE